MLSLNQILDILPLESRNSIGLQNPSLLRVMGIVNTIESWFQKSRTPFFPHYTDHSEIHAFEVFKSSIELIDADCWNLVSVEDISSLLLSCYLHDAGMHITEKQFVDIISPENSDILCSMDTQTWPNLWKKFVEEAKRFNESTRVEIFGDAEAISVPPDDTSKFTERHRLLIGEFIRRNHPRFSHDLTLGLSSAIGLGALFSPISADFADVCGLIARSHGLAIRDTFDYVSKRFDKKTYQGIHIIYLMTLIRIADYAQIQSSRAPEVHGQIHKIRSPISQQEWRVHQAITNLHTESDDPEALFVKAEPDSVRDYVRVKSWLSGFQSELDTSWAILGETYGRHSKSGLDRLGITLRRVASNLNSVDLPYEKEAFRFRVAEAEMLALLLAPLYGNDPLYGVRELIQNARDATIERAASSTSEVTPEIRVDLKNSGEQHTLTISDNGSGMTVEIIKNYFLNAGASYRSSKDWRTSFSDEFGSSKIMRSGRFGVGALAAFLIGESLEVKTRHHLDTTGYGSHFSCELHSQTIEIRRVAMDVGTTIIIQTDQDRFDKIRSFEGAFQLLFQFDESVGLFVTHSTDETGEQNIFESIPTESITEKVLFEFGTSKYPSVRLLKNKTQLPDYVNGIAICAIDRKDMTTDRSIYGRGNFFTPARLSSSNYGYYNKASITRSGNFSVSVEDRNGLAPLNLARSAFSQSDPEINDTIDGYFFREFCEVIKQRLLPKSAKPTKKNATMSVPSTSLVWNKEGVAPLDRDILPTLGKKLLVALPCPPNQNILDLESYSDKLLVETENNSLAPTSLLQQMRQLSYLTYRNYCDTVISIHDKNDTDAILSLKKIPNWIYNTIINADVVSQHGTDYAVLIFGNKNYAQKSTINNVVNSIKMPFYQIYYSNNLFVDETITQERQREGTLTNLWTDNFGTFASLEKLDKLAN